MHEVIFNEGATFSHKPLGFGQGQRIHFTLFTRISLSPTPPFLKYLVNPPPSKLPSHHACLIVCLFVSNKRQND